MNDLESVLVLSNALTQFIENATEEGTEEEAHQVRLAEGMLNQVDAILANLAR